MATCGRTRPAAQKLMRERQSLSDAIETYRRIEGDLSANAEMIELAEEEGDAELVSEAEGNLRRWPRWPPRRSWRRF